VQGDQKPQLNHLVTKLSRNHAEKELHQIGAFIGSQKDGDHVEVFLSFYY